MEAEHPFAELFRASERTETQTVSFSSQNSCTIPTLCSIFTEGKFENEHHGCEYLGSWGLCRLRRVFSLCFSERGWKTGLTYVVKLCFDKYLVINSLTSEIMLHLRHVSSIFFPSLASWTFNKSRSTGERPTPILEVFLSRIWSHHNSVSRIDSTTCPEDPGGPLGRFLKFLDGLTEWISR